MMNFRSYNNQRNQQFDAYGNSLKDSMSGSEFNNSNPLVHLNESVNSLDPLNAMEKSLNDQVIKILLPSANFSACLLILFILFFCNRCHTHLIHHTRRVEITIR